MASRQVYQELVVLFDAAGSRIDLEMRYGQFSGLLGQKGTLTSHAGQTVKAAYAQVGAGLAVEAAVFFLFKVNAEGYLDPAFNLPLEYMAEHAGPGPDLGRGTIRMACRSQCPVPWHAINMWEPAGDKQSHPAMLLQKAVWRNRLGLKPMPVVRQSDAVARLGATRQETRETQPAAEVQVAPVQLDQAVNGLPTGLPSAPPSGLPNVPAALPKLRAQVQAKIQARMHAMEEKLAAAFGGHGRGRQGSSAGAAERVDEVTTRLREEMARQQQVYLEQIKSCREEIQKLKAALRHEQERSRRLQQLLRGDV